MPALGLGLGLPFRTGGGPRSALAALTQLGLASGFKLLLDAGDATSYTSGQTWADRSGTGTDFFRGADGNASGADPTFNGTAGGLSGNEYFSFDAGDYFTRAAANDAWIQTLHKAAIKVWGFAWVWLGSTGTQFLFGNNAGGLSNVGFCWGLTSATVPTVVVSNGSGSAVLNQTAGGSALAAGQWHFIAFALDEAAGAGGLRWVTNTVIGTPDNATYASPSSSDATFTTQVAARGNNNLVLTNTSRLAMIGIATGVDVPSNAQLASLRDATRGRFSV